jgi:hypothetical protein
VDNGILIPSNAGYLNTNGKKGKNDEGYHQLDDYQFYPD